MQIGSCGCDTEARLMSKLTHRVDKFSKFLPYVLGYRPDEFGIVPDAAGFVGIKELLQALHEEPEWRHIRAFHLSEVAAVSAGPAVETVEGRIRAVDRSKLPAAATMVTFPKLLYIAIRRRAYPVVLEKGMTASNRPNLVLAMDQAMAMRIGRRVDNDPILLTVQVSASVENGTRFQKYGQHLVLADRIAAGTFSGPALPKDKPETKPAGPSIKPSSQPKTPGSFFPEPDRFHPPVHRPPAGNRRREPDWKKERRQARRNKQRQNN